MLKRYSPSVRPWTLAALSRAAFTIALIGVVESLVFGAAAALPSLLFVFVWKQAESPWSGAVTMAFAAGPAYLMFALSLMVVSAAMMRITGARTPTAAEMPIAEMPWPLLNWVRAMASTHVVRVFAGVVFRGSPIWTMYLRMCGARIGRRVYVNSLFLSDYNLLTFGHDVVIGAGVHLSGHTVERGVVKTGAVTLGDRVTIGLSTIVEIDVEIGARAQIGALSFVPKHARLESGEVYIGVPARPLSPPAILGTK
jgi:acetyltransferase-like isoleucine patch superfamily enzyme